MGRTSTDAGALEALLKARHATVMEGRPDRRPGAFKQEANQAGPTVFVAPDLVTGTLAQGFGLCRSQETPFQRAVFMMFLIAEVHPFADGNGRTARIMMNAELAAAGEERIIVPTVYRANYLSWRILQCTEPSWTDPEEAIVRAVRANAAAVTGGDVVVNLRAGFSDARFYRHAGVPSVVYGVGAHHMGGVDEYATVEDLKAVFAVHTLAGFDYLKRG